MMEKEFSTQHLCELLQVSRSAYYAWKSGKSYQISEPKQALSQQVKEVFDTHKRRYGSRRLLVELQAKGVSVGRCQIRSIMQRQGLSAIQPSSFVPRTTDSRHGQRVCPNLLLAEPFPTAPNKIWVSDITYIPLADGQWAYLGTWMDLYSRMLVGWQLEDHMEQSLIITPLQKALALAESTRVAKTGSWLDGSLRPGRTICIHCTQKIDCPSPTAPEHEPGR